MYITISTIILFIILISAIIFFISIKLFYKKDSNSIPVEYLQSMNYLLAEQPDKALDTFMSMVGVNQDTAETHIILGNLFRNRGEVDRAIRIHQNLIARPDLENKIRQECSLELAKDYLKSGFLDRAELIFTRLSSEVKKPHEILFYLKDIYEQEKEWQKAIDISIKIQSLSNEDLSDIIAHYYCELADNEISINGKNGMEKAKKYTNKAFGYNKKSLRTLILLGDISYEGENYLDALKKYMNIHENYPEYSYLVLEKLKKTHERLDTKDNFLTLLKRLSGITNTIDLYSSLNNDFPEGISSKEISDMYESDFKNGKVSLLQLSEYLELINKNRIAFDNESLNNIRNCLKNYALKEKAHICINCGFKSVKHFWQCPSCQRWSSIKKSTFDKSKVDHYVV
jgi:lipopolysaccharide biosynthesis regulator YciM